jgi:hypothetical protein
MLCPHLLKAVCFLIADIFLALQLVDLTLELLLVFIPGLIWFFDRYRKFLLLSYIPSPNAPFTLLFSESLSTSFFSILPSCTSSLVTSTEILILVIDCYMYLQITFSNMPFVPHPFSSISYFNASAV